MPQLLGDRLSAYRRVATVVTLGLLTGLGPLTVDLHLPTFPALKTDLGATDPQVQVALSTITLGLALGQFAVGPLSDRLGRRILLIVTASLYITSSVLVVVIPNIISLTTARVLQGIGAAGGAVVSMAMTRDLFSGWRLVVMLSRLALINGLASIVAPLIGSWVVTVISWRGIFWALVSYGAILLVLTLSLIVETRLPGECTADGFALFRAAYRQVLGDRVFAGIWLTASYCSADLFSYISASSLLLQEAFGLRETEFGVVFAIYSIGVFAGVQLGSRLSMYLNSQRVPAVGTAGMIAAASALLGPDVMHSDHIPLILMIFAYIPAFGAYSPTAQVPALQNHCVDSGVTIFLIGALNMVLAIVMGLVIGQFELTLAAPMVIAIFCCATAVVLCLWLITRPRRIEFML